MRPIDHENEVWVDLDEFPGYQISTHGRVRNYRTGRILKPFPDRYGYLRVSIGNRDNVYLHRLVAETFYPDHEDGYQVNHIDSDRQNNWILNLEWVSPRENVKWAYDRGNGKYSQRRATEVASYKNRRPVEIVELGICFRGIVDCADYLGVAPQNVSRVLKGDRRKLHGYTIRYADKSNYEGW